MISNFYLSAFGMAVALAVVIKTAYLLSSKLMIEEIAAIFAFAATVFAFTFFY